MDPNAAHQKLNQLMIDIANLIDRNNLADFPEAKLVDVPSWKGAELDELDFWRAVGSVIEKASEASDIWTGLNRWLSTQGFLPTAWDSQDGFGRRKCNPS